MNISIAKDQIIAGLQTVQNIVGSRTTLPILSNVLLRAEEGRLSLMATDLDVTISSAVTAVVKTPGSLTVPVKRLFEMVRELGGLEVELETDDKNVAYIRSGSSNFKMFGLSAEEFPPIALPKDARKLTLPQAKLKAMLRKTSFAMSTDESRYVLNGLFMSIKDQKCTMVATDGRRLALAEEEAEVPAGSQGDFIIPIKTVNELLRLLTDKGVVEIQIGENLASFSLLQEGAENAAFTTIVISKLVEGNYPNYRQVIPSECRERVALPLEEFLHALRRAEIMTSDKSNSVKLTFENNILALSSNTPEVGEARESMAINYSGPSISVAFNPTYLIQPLNALEVDEVFFELIDELSPGVLKINGPFLYVVMPMRLN